MTQHLVWMGPRCQIWRSTNLRLSLSSSAGGTPYFTISHVICGGTLLQGSYKMNWTIKKKVHTIPFCHLDISLTLIPWIVAFHEITQWLSQKICNFSHLSNIVCMIPSYQGFTFNYWVDKYKPISTTTIYNNYMLSTTSGYLC